MRDLVQGGSEDDWFNVTGERVDGITRLRLSRARETGDRWDNPILSSCANSKRCLPSATCPVSTMWPFRVSMWLAGEPFR